MDIGEDFISRAVPYRVFQPWQVERERGWLARAALETLQVWSKISECPTGIISDAVARGNLGGVYDLLRSMGAFADAEDQSGDSVSQVSFAGDGAAVADSEKISVASILSTLEVDYKTVCLAAYRHSRIKMALLDVTNTISMSTLSQHFSSLWTETPVIKPTTAGKASANDNSCSASQETKSETRTGLVDVLVAGDSRPMADQSKGRIALSAVVPVRHADVLDTCGMVHTSTFTFTGAKSGAVACTPPLKIIPKNVRTRRVLVPKRMFTATSRNRAKTARRLSCPTSSVAIAQRLLQQVKEPSAPILGAYRPLAALPLQQANHPAVPVIGAHIPLAAPVTTADEGHTKVMGTMPLRSARVTNKYHVLQAILRGTLLPTGQGWIINTSVGIPFEPAGRLREVVCLAHGDRVPLNIAKDQMVLSAAAPSVSYNTAGVQVARDGWLHEFERHRRTTLEEALRTGCFGTLRALFGDTALAYVHDEPGGNPVQVDRYFSNRKTAEQQLLLDPCVPECTTYPAENKLLPSICCDSVVDDPDLLQREPTAHVPRYDAASLLRGSIARERARLARSFVALITSDRVTKALVLHEVRAVHKLVNAVYLDDEAAIRNQFTGEAPMAVARVGCLRLLHKAAEANNRRAIAALLEVGCDANVLDSAGVSPLHVATEYGFAGVVHMLLDAHADCQAVDANGDSALMKAA